MPEHESVLQDWLQALFRHWALRLQILHCWGGNVVFYEKFLGLCAGKGVTKGKACLDSGLGKSSWKNWTNGKRPTYRNMVKLADYFGIPVTELFEYGGSVPEKEQSGKPGPNDTLDFNTIAGYSSLTEAEKEGIWKKTRTFVQFYIESALCDENSKG